MYSKIVKLLVLAAGVAGAQTAFGGIAAAADMPAKAPAAIVSDSWTGVYVGGNVGGAWSKVHSTITDPDNSLGLTGGLVPINFDSRASSVIGGLQIGYNRQFAAWLVGVEADLDFLNARASSSLAPFVSLLPPANSFSNTTVNVRGIGSIRGRLGYVWDRLLLYGTGGVAFANIKYSGDVGCPSTGVFGCGFNAHAPFSSTKTQTGWIAGGGLEYMLTRNWIIGGEYLYSRFRGNTFTGTTVDINTGVPTGGAASYAFGNLTVQQARARLSYKF